MAEKIIFNNSATEARIQVQVDEVIQLIKTNCAAGRRDTEVYVDRDIFYRVIDEVKVRVDWNDFTIPVVEKGINQYTGKVQNFWAKRVGDQMYCIVRYIG